MNIDALTKWIIPILQETGWLDSHCSENPDLIADRCRFSVYDFLFSSPSALPSSALYPEASLSICCGFSPPRFPVSIEMVHRKWKVIFGFGGINLEYEFWIFNLAFFLSEQIHICLLLRIKWTIIKLIKQCYKN